MGDTDDDERYLQKSHSSNLKKHLFYSHPIQKLNDYYIEGEDDDADNEDECNDYFEQKGNENGAQRDNPNGYYPNFEENDGFNRYPKRQKLRYSIPGNEFALASDAKLFDGWTEHEAFVLLEVWSDRFLQLGRRSLRSEDWIDVADKVSEELRIDKKKAQCRQLVDKLKRKYKKEKVKVEKQGLNSSKWVFFRKMDMLMGSSSRQESGLACGVDSGEFVFMNTRVYLDRSNGFDEMVDSPDGSEIEDNDEEGDGDYGRRGGIRKERSSCRLLADSVQKFGEIYEKIEISKKAQMMELEKMRLEFRKELELQKKHILERVEAEIAKIQEEDGEEENDDVSTESLSE